jgi:acyl-coenzyme A thioesterase PaaI-like protein
VSSPVEPAVGAATRRLGHYARCFGCGGANPRGLELEVHWDGSEAQLTHTPPPDAEGAPGVVHGGYISAIVDEVMALAASAGEIPAMTRRIEVDYRAPALTGAPLDVRATVASVGKRTVNTRLTARPVGQDHICFEATGVYVKIPVQAWLRQMAPRDATTGAVDLSSTSTSTYFRYQAHALEQLFTPERLERPVALAVRVSDVEPQEWCFRAEPDGLVVEERHCEAPDAALQLDFHSWDALLHDPSRLPEMVDGGAVRLEGDERRVEAFLDCLPVNV